MKNINKSLQEEVASLISIGNSPADIKKVISERTGFKKTKCNEIYNYIYKNVDISDDIFDFELNEEEPAQKPYFNEKTRKYIVYINALGRNIVISEAKHKQVLQMYSDWDHEARTITEICRAIQWPRQVLVEYLKKFHINHDTLPITDQDLDNEVDEELTSRLRELRKFNLYQKLEKEGWDDIKKDADKWRRFQYSIYDPFEEAINDWQPPKFQGRLPKLKTKGSNSLVAVLSDLHFGGFSKPNLTFRKLNLTSHIIRDRVIKLAQDTAADARSQNLSDINVLMLGDILNTCNSQGTTGKGTVIESDLKGGELFKFALTALCEYFNILLSTGIPISVYGLTGNHDSSLGQALLYALEAYYSHMSDRIVFDISDKYIEARKLRNSTIAFSHGAHWETKAKIPVGQKSKNYARSLFLEAQKQLGISNHNVLITCDLHHSHIEEFNDYTYVLHPSITGGCNFSDTLNLNARACQQTFLFSDDGMKTVNSYYFS